MKPHGLKGEVTVSIDKDCPNDFASLQTIFLQKGSQFVPYFIESISLKGDKAFVKFEDVNNPETATQISKHAIYLPMKERPKLVRGEFYDDEIIGFTVTDETSGLIGKVVEIVHSGPNKLLAIDNQGKEVLIPINGPFITRITKIRSEIIVSLPEGFLDI
ncbi:MAG: 16S rRNA processing protein RimM [Cyclobacteriaceae bacterium]|nr:16S rRNA processing protein RimM [Cyclobacteriaceae bacterium]